MKLSRLMASMEEAGIRPSEPVSTFGVVPPRMHNGLVGEW